MCLLNMEDQSSNKNFADFLPDDFLFTFNVIKNVQLQSI